MCRASKYRAKINLNKLLPAPPSLPVAPRINSCCVACARLCVSVVGQTDNSVWNLSGGHRISQTSYSMLTKPRPCAKHAQQFAYHLADSIIRHNLLLSSQQTTDVSDCSKLHAGQLWALWKVHHTKKLMSVILPTLAIGHTPTEELCFLLLFSAEPQQYHQHAHCTLIITTRRLFSSFMTQTNTRCSY